MSAPLAPRDPSTILRDHSRRLDAVERLVLRQRVTTPTSSGDFIRQGGGFTMDFESPLDNANFDFEVGSGDSYFNFYVADEGADMGSSQLYLFASDDANEYGAVSILTNAFYSPTSVRGIVSVESNDHLVEMRIDGSDSTDSCGYISIGPSTSTPPSSGTVVRIFVTNVAGVRKLWALFPGGEQRLLADEAAAGFTTEDIQDIVGGFFGDTASIDVTYDDAGNAITAAVSVEWMQDAIASFLIDTGTIDVVYDDAGNAIHFDVLGGSSNIDDGTATGQMAYWDDTGGSWVPATDLFYDQSSSTFSQTTGGVIQSIDADDYFAMLLVDGGSPTLDLYGEDGATSYAEVIAQAYGGRNASIGLFTPSGDAAFLVSDEDEAANYLQLNESTASPNAPAAGRVKVFSRVVAGKTELCARFNSGAVQVIKTEP